MIHILFRGIRGELTVTQMDVIGNGKFPYVYGLRHREDDWDWPYTIEPYVCANRWGVIRLHKALKFNPRRDFLTLTYDESDYLSRMAQYEVMRA